MNLLEDLKMIEKNLRSKKAKEAFRRLCERNAIANAVKHEVYLEAQKLASTDPNRKCRWCGKIGGEHYQYCNINSDGAPDWWVVDVPEA